jgi:hypothetical protein
MTELIIIVSPAFDRRGKRRHGRFDARLKGFEEIICKATQQPLLDASRVLLRRGFDSSTVICMVRSDAPTIVTLRAPIGVAGQFDVMGGRFIRRTPAAGPMPASRIENLVSGGPRGPRSSNAALEASHNGSSKTTKPSAAPSSTPSPAATTTAGN